MRRLATILGAAALTAVLAGCDQVSDAVGSADAAADKASICIDAVKLAGFYPDLSNPEQAVKDAENTAKKLSDLAERAGDKTLKEALSDMSGKVAELTPSTLDPANVATWAKEKAGALNALTQACM